ncbi:MAG: hypothetical protein WBW74_11530 [Xanthobacteraceae bacterium]
MVDQILATKIFYLQAGRPRDRFITKPSAPKIFVGVPDTGIREHWNKLFHKRLAKDMRAKGLGRQQAKRAAAQAIADMRAFGRLRMKAK